MRDPIYTNFVGETFYSKRKHGSVPIHIIQEAQKVYFKMGENRYPTARSLFTQLYGRKTHISFSQYFPTVAKKQKPSFDLAEEVFKISIEPKERLGVDLHNRSHEVKKLFYAGFGSRCQVSGYDPEDVLQEIYKGLIARNNGKCPFNPKKSSFGHYVHMVCGCIVANYHRKIKKLREREQVGVSTFKDGKLQTVDAALCATSVDEKTPEFHVQERVAIDSLKRFISRHNAELLPIMEGLRVGKTRKDMARELNIEIRDVNTKVKHVRKLTQKWAERVQT